MRERDLVEGELSERGPVMKLWCPFSLFIYYLLFFFHIEQQQQLGHHITYYLSGFKFEMYFI